ncbi:hypothetical protein FGO68_gene13956 [Halteria grandinella]|uniref:Histone deacetylase domain-containing protein n=1 Tax=Halteria grandinella TaxID=5974 RepID=A0A8J8T7T2_HALGN|nr:hypothetical protein FGO68_gene13956 [Halteria grandinella]
MVTEFDYQWLTSELQKVANYCCQGRLVSVLEGGYNTNLGPISPLAQSVAYHVRALANTTTSNLNEVYLQGPSVIGKRVNHFAEEEEEEEEYDMDQIVQERTFVSKLWAQRHKRVRNSQKTHPAAAIEQNVEAQPEIQVEGAELLPPYDAVEEVAAADQEYEFEEEPDEEGKQ